GLVHQRQVLAAPPGALERVPDHPRHTERRVDADFGRDLVGGADADRATVAGVWTLGPLAHHHEVDVRVPRERTAHPGVQPAGTEVDVVVQLKTHTQQQASLQYAAGNRRVADRAEQDGVVLAQLGDHGVRQHLAGRVETPRTEVVLGLIHPRQDHIENLERLRDDLGAN